MIGFSDRRHDHVGDPGKTKTYPVLSGNLSRMAENLTDSYTSGHEGKKLVGNPGLEPGISCFQGKRVKPFPKFPSK